MRNPDKRSANVPDSAESRERSDPKKEPGLGKMHETRNTPVNEPEHHPKSNEKDKHRRAINANEVTDQSEAVNPTDRNADGRREP